MIARIILTIVFVLLGLIIVLPFALSLAGVNIFQFGAISGQGVGEGEAVILRSLNGGEDWENVSIAEERRTRFPTRLLDVSFHPTNPDVIFLGTLGSGLWKSANGGTFWTRVQDKNNALASNSDVYRVSISRSNPKIIYLAVFQNKKGRLLRSNDGGESFKEIYFVTADRLAVFDVQVDPYSPDIAIISTDQGGVLETRDGGKSWRVLKWFTTGVRNLIINPLDTSEMFAVTDRDELFKSVDSGTNWSSLSATAQGGKELVPQFPQSPLGLFTGAGRFSIEALILDPNNSTILYLGSREGLLRSLDGGFTWENLKVLIPPEALPVNAVAVHPRSSQIIYAGASTQLHKTKDGGVTWSVKILPTSARIRSLLINPLRPEEIFAVFGK